MTGRYRCVDSGETYAGGLREAARMNTTSQTAGYIEVFGNYSYLASGDVRTSAGCKCYT